MRRSLAVVLACALVLGATGCGSQEEKTPTACLQGADAYAKALKAAPGEVRVGGEALISECLAQNQEAGELATVGEAMVKTAVRLNSEARAEPGGRANLELGYLLGAAQHGAADTEGIHVELLRRLTVAARFAPGKVPLSPEFLSTYREGFDAGHSGG
jgi:hypothetical protein